VSNIRKHLILAVIAVSVISNYSSATSLSIENEYDLTGISYPNLDFDTSTSTDSIAFYTQRLRVSISGKFSPELEVFTKFQMLGVVGSSNPWQQFNWQKNYPYPNMNFQPFIENAYMKAYGFEDLPIELTIGKQPLEYGAGLIISDNDAGINALKLVVNYPFELRTEIFTAKLKENFFQSSDLDLQGVVAIYPLNDKKLEIGFFEERDFTGTPYVQGLTSKLTNKINKIYYDLRYSKQGKTGHYFVELAYQKGTIDLQDGTNMILDGKAFSAQVFMTNEKSRIGKVTAFGNFSASSGDQNPTGTSAGNIDESFNPSFSRRYNGLKKKGWGEYFSSSFSDCLWDVPRDAATGIPNYSGLGVIGYGLDFSPWFGWTFGIAQYGYSASESINTNAPKLSGGSISIGGSGASIESLGGILVSGDLTKKIYNLGGELNLTMSYTYSKYLLFKFGFLRYTPPVFAEIWPRSETTEAFTFETNFKF